MKWIFGLSIWLIAVVGCTTTTPTPTAAVSAPISSGGDPMLILTSSAFEPGTPIPARYSCDGNDISPPLAWHGVPPDTQSFALIFDDPDAPGGTWDHWLLFNLPADTRTLPENATLPAETSVGKNSWGRTDYGGPCPPRGTHRYFFKLYALDTPLSLTTGASKSEIETAMRGHILAHTELMGTFTR